MNGINPNNAMIDDDQNGTPVHTLKKHLNNIGYVPQPQQMDQMQQLQQIQQIQNFQQMQQRIKSEQMMREQQMAEQLMLQQQMLQQQQQLQQQQTKSKQPYRNKSKSNKKIKSDNGNKQSDITHLVSDINKSLDNYSPSNQDVPHDDNLSEEDNSDDENDDTTYFPEWSREFILIVVIYVILSQNFVKTLVGKYVKYINPCDDGTVSFIGVIIYGIILAVLYILSKKLFI